MPLKDKELYYDMYLMLDSLAELAKNASEDGTTLPPAPEGCSHLVLTVPDPQSYEDAYGQYVLAWMLQHAASPEDLRCGIARHLSDILVEDGDEHLDRYRMLDATRSALSRFETDEGFEGSAYVSFPEWLSSEESDYARSMLAAKKAKKAAEQLSEDAEDAAQRTDFEEDLPEKEGVKPIVAAHAAKDDEPATPPTPPQPQPEETRPEETDFHVDVEADEAEVASIASILEPGNMPRKTLSDNSGPRRRELAGNHATESADLESGFSLPSQRSRAAEKHGTPSRKGR